MKLVGANGILPSDLFPHKGKMRCLNKKGTLKFVNIFLKQAKGISLKGRAV